LLLSRGYLLSVRLRAIRRGVWWRVLCRVERATFDLTIRVVDCVRSRLLSEILMKIVGKLEEALNAVELRVARVGRPVALKLSRLAVGWGYLEARSWASDRSFMRYLAIMSLSDSRTFT